MARYIRERVGTFNAVETKKRGLLRDRALRAALVLGWAIHHRIGILAVQESGTFLQRVVRDRRWWQAFYSRPQYRQGELRRGVGILHRLRWRELDRATISVEHMDDRARDAIETGYVSAPVLLLQRRNRWRARRASVVTIAVHGPWRRGDEDDSARRGLRRRVLATVRACQAAGLEVIVAGDTNGIYFSEPGVLRVVAKHGVDVIYATPSIQDDGGGVTWRRKLSDHAALWARLLIPVNPEAPRRLP